ncbi:hypothetical protein F0562_029885 [Nyssa sinensis]|uniref:Cell wall hydroxyproline-rich glycoprotein n=1 Tax=Nyssa sinensis TaxID=561372 RepID=A0A5J5AWR8_9ASTE|nr:hypothetical protein F0562_029885 [Nyssa sinensis]
MAFLLLQILAAEADLSMGGGVGVGVGVGVGIGIGGGGGVWIGGGINGQTPPGSSVSKLKQAYTALQAWKSAITDDPLGILGTWVGSNVCVYKGVFCVDSTDPQTGPIVAGIDLNHANLQGTLVKELCLLTDLSLFHLNSNRFTGTVPESFKILSSLSELDLSNNQFSGPFPTSTLLIPNLFYLDLRFNNFAGPIPEDLFNKRLDAIFLNNNQFDGQIPANLGNSPASVINLANNKLSGNIPFSFGYMGSGLKEILFLNNQLTGCIPEGIGLWQDLQVLDVSFNSFMGHLPNSISCLDEIEVLNLAHNKLSGQDCNKLLFRNNVGFDFSLNCIPGLEMQRPQPQCSVTPGNSLNCLRIPSAKTLFCGALVESQKISPRPSSSP